MRAWLRVGLLAAALGSAASVSAQDARTQRDGQGAVTVAVTLAGPPEVGVPIRGTIVLDTHAGSLDDVVFEHEVALRTPKQRGRAKSPFASLLVTHARLSRMVP
jgi:hypothetical protein